MNRKHISRMAYQCATGRMLPSERRKRRFMGMLDLVVGWLRRIFNRPRYVMGWDMGEGRDYWVKSRIHADGTIEIVDQGVNEHKTANRELD